MVLVRETARQNSVTRFALPSDNSPGTPLAPLDSPHYHTAVNTRRTFAASLLAAAAARAANPLANLKIGVTDWNLRMAGDPKAVATAAGLKFDGVEVSLGRIARDN